MYLPVLRMFLEDVQTEKAVESGELTFFISCGVLVFIPQFRVCAHSICFTLIHRTKDSSLARQDLFVL